MLRAIYAMACAAALCGCASFGYGVSDAGGPKTQLTAEQPAKVKSAEAPLQQRRVDGVTPATLRQLEQARPGGPVGLAPCQRGSFYADNCWRKGDHHVLFPDAAPSGLEASPPASDQ